MFGPLLISSHEGAHFEHRDDKPRTLNNKQGRHTMHAALKGSPGVVSPPNQKNMERKFQLIRLLPLSTIIVLADNT